MRGRAFEIHDALALPAGHVADPLGAGEAEQEVVVAEVRGDVSELDVEEPEPFDAGAADDVRVAVRRGADRRVHPGEAAPRHVRDAPERVEIRIAARADREAGVRGEVDRRVRGHGAAADRDPARVEEEPRTVDADRRLEPALRERDHAGIALGLTVRPRERPQVAKVCRELPRDGGRPERSGHRGAPVELEAHPRIAHAEPVEHLRELRSVELDLAHHRRAAGEADGASRREAALVERDLEPLHDDLAALRAAALPAPRRLAAHRSGRGSTRPWPSARARAAAHGPPRRPPRSPRRPSLTPASASASAMRPCAVAAMSREGSQRSLTSPRAPSRTPATSISAPCSVALERLSATSTSADAAVAVIARPWPGEAHRPRGDLDARAPEGRAERAERARGRAGVDVEPVDHDATAAGERDVERAVLHVEVADLEPRQDGGRTRRPATGHVRAADAAARRAAGGRGAARRGAAGARAPGWARAARRARLR